MDRLLRSSPWNGKHLPINQAMTEIYLYDGTYSKAIAQANYTLQAHGADSYNLFLLGRSYLFNGDRRQDLGNLCRVAKGTRD